MHTLAVPSIHCVYKFDMIHLPFYLFKAEDHPRALEAAIRISSGVLVPRRQGEISVSLAKLGHVYKKYLV